MVYGEINVCLLLPEFKVGKVVIKGKDINDTIHSHPRSLYVYRSILSNSMLDNVRVVYPKFGNPVQSKDICM